MAQRSIRWCQSRLFLARRDARELVPRPPGRSKLLLVSDRNQDVPPNRSGATKILVDHHHALETKRLRPFAQIILAALAFKT